ncbi:Flp pilus assembly protein CpaB [Paraburkholderia acidisoli]|uniref:Flp pilus assembly protein CpaB n=1 Tax=Paraburkholderia acidisoli TaxID=2571748 RepID=A0A7Z2JD89_9BURK|nr:Flp pilus assembly protein CpaB [Paraburkholderia acidisoli]QGZ60366.1 Flp pilus assembly protein CpaB [Paraburkholderia acidisoli]
MSNIVKVGFLVILAALVALILRGFFIAASKPAGPQEPTTDRIRIAAADLPRGLLLRDDDLNWKAVPHESTPAGAVIDGPQHDVTLKGAVLRHAVTAGAPILASDVIQANAPGFLSATLHPDMRAVSVAIDDVSGNAGLIQPGDYVDLILTQSMQGKTDSPDESVSSETVVQHARVLAVGSELVPSKDSTDANTRARTVTLEVSPHTAEAIAVAARLGSLSLALRSFATLDRAANAASAPDATSDTLPSAQPVWAGDISRALRALPGNVRNANAGGTPLPAAPVAAPSVTIYRGSAVTTQSDNNAVPVMHGSGAGGGGPLPQPTIGVPPLPSPMAQTFGMH